MGVVLCHSGISLSHGGFRSGFVWRCQAAAGGSVFVRNSAEMQTSCWRARRREWGQHVRLCTPWDALPAWRGQEHPGYLDGMFP